jgi:hypothetical protein
MLDCVKRVKYCLDDFLSNGAVLPEISMAIITQCMNLASFAHYLHQKRGEEYL